MFSQSSGYQQKLHTMPVVSGDCKNGYGKFKFDNGVYEGNFRNGKRHGQGTLTHTNGERYEGEWSDGKLHGQGTLTFTDGNVYEGQFSDNNMHGTGTLIFGEQRLQQLH